MTEIATPLPRSVAVVKIETYQKLIHEGKHVEALSDLSAMIVPQTGDIRVNVSEVSRVRDLLQAADQLQSGELYIKDPFSDRAYVQMQNAQETLADLAITKYHHMANAVRMLGATAIEFKDAKADTSSLLIAVDGQGTTPSKMPAKASIGIEKRLEEQLQGRMEFEGSPSDPERALEFLRRHHLDSDQQLRTLVEMRTAPNLILNYRLTINSTREFALNVKAAVGLASALGLDLGMDYKSVTAIQIVTEIGF